MGATSQSLNSSILFWLSAPCSSQTILSFPNHFQDAAQSLTLLSELRIIQSLNLFHLFLWLRLVREQMAIFSSVSVIRSHSLRQQWLKQIPGPLQSHHLVFPSAWPPLLAWARLPPALRREAGSPESRWRAQPRCLHLSPTPSLRNAKLWRVAGVAGMHISPLLGFGKFGATLSGSHGAFLCGDTVRATPWDSAPVANWEAASQEEKPEGVSAAPPFLSPEEMGVFRVVKH